VFAARDVTGVALAAIDHVIAVTAVGPTTVYWRPYFVHMKKSASKVPRVELTMMGPSLDLQLRRVHAASADLEKAAMRQPKACVTTRPRGGGAERCDVHTAFVTARLLIATTALSTNTSPCLSPSRSLDAKKAKNTTTNLFGETLGHVHMERQDFSKLSMRKGKAAQADRRKRARGGDDEAEAGGEGGDDEGGAMDVDGGDVGAGAGSSSAAAAAAATTDPDDDDMPAARKQKKAKRAKNVRGGAGEFDA
jgi:hypothetical protein